MMFLSHGTSFEAKLLPRLPTMRIAMEVWNAMVYGAVGAIGKDDTGGGVREDGAHDEYWGE
jgi:hypothetical protein